ncbi:hypothetical protein MLD38_006271 [Melastoma candidum]|uniref:Uncharacterized protein n=1 Tax=Melastoma candidum TaxID=119954 RepID=A0ACB9RLQ3_9MYRT|nr:hypothetical protein MLD38_006271 [Melastoma candidum]
MASHTADQTTQGLPASMIGNASGLTAIAATSAPALGLSFPVSTTAEINMMFPPFNAATPTFNMGQSGSGSTLPTHIPPITAFTSSAIQSSTTPPAVEVLDNANPDQSTMDNTLSQKVDVLTTELDSLKQMMAQLLQRQLTALEIPIPTPTSTHFTTPPMVQKFPIMWTKAWVAGW